MPEQKVKRYEDWKGDLGEFLKPGDLVDDEIYEQFLNVLPPAYWTATLVQMGEPHNHVRGRATYPTLMRTANGWEYRGNCFRGETQTIPDPPR